MRQPSLRSLRTHLRRYIRGRKTLWTLNAILFIICLSLFLDSHLKRSDSSSIRVGWEGEKYVGTEVLGRNRAKPSRPEGVARDLGSYRKGKIPEARSGQASEPVLPEESKRAERPVEEASKPEPAETPHSQPTQDEPKSPAFCTMDQYAQGTWHARPDPPKTLDEIRRLTSLSEAGAMGCHPIQWPVELVGEPKYDEPTHVQRMLESARWKWVPGGLTSSGCKKRELNRDVLVRRLLRSKGGLFLVGDSLTEQHGLMIRNLLVHPGGPWEVIGWGDRPRFEAVVLNKAHPDAAGILKDAGVSESRGDRPIVTLYLERHLISRSEMDEIMRHAEGAGYEPFSSGPDKGRTEFIGESIWYDEYLKVMNSPDVELLDPRVEEEDTVLMLNSGPHWINNQFTTREVEFYPEMLQGWENMIELLLRKIDDVPSTKQSVFWRATAPGHPHCELSSHAENRTDFRSTTDPNFRRYNWDLFDQLNSRWKKRLGGEPGGLGKDPTTGMQYLDIWPMSVQRPDAHLMPPNDCLHWCYGVGGVVEEWQKFFWHTIASQSRNSDYNVDEPVYL